MTIAFPDLSNYQRGLRIQPATVAVVAKATEGNYYQDGSYNNFRQQTANEGGLFSSYHYLRAGYGAAQAGYWRRFAGDAPGMLDVEDGSGGLSDILAFKQEADNLGAKVWGVYLPHWYWQQIGAPNLAPLDDAGLALVSSSYTAYSDTGSGWYSYGGMTPVIWQWTDKLSYGGQAVDFNAYKGTVAELASLWGIGGSVAPATPILHLWIVDMCAKEDPTRPQGQTTNSNQVFPIQEALVAKGFLSNENPYWGRGAFGTMTVAAYAEWQRSLGYQGSAADGIPGMTSLTRLGAETGFFTVVP